MWDGLARQVPVHLDLMGVPADRVATAVFFVAVGLLLHRSLGRALTRRVMVWLHDRGYTGADKPLDALREPLSWAFLLVAVWLAKLAIAAHLSEHLVELLLVGFDFAIALLVAWFLLRTIPAASAWLHQVAEERDIPLLALAMPVVKPAGQVIAVFIVVSKLAEVVLGASAAGLLGLLGGTGLTLGLVFKEVLQDVMSTTIIFADALYRKGDLIGLPSGGWGTVHHIGFRSTLVEDYYSKVMRRLPNTQMIDGKVENWTQTSRWGLRFQVRFDLLTSSQVEELLVRLRAGLEQVEGIDHSMAKLARIDGNARVVDLRAQMNGKSGYFDSIEAMNFCVLRATEELNIKTFEVNYTLFKAEGSEGSAARSVSPLHAVLAK